MAYFFMGDFMVDRKVHICYAENGKSFEEVFAEGIRKANLKAIKAQIINSGDTSPATSEKGVTKDE